MQFELSQAIQVLERTPLLLRAWLHGLPDHWIMPNEGPETFSPFDVLGHLVHGERTDWVLRMNCILHTPETPFTPFDRFAQYEASKGKTMNQLLEEFSQLRAASLQTLRDANLSPTDLDRTGIHPKFGTVTLRQLLSTWAVHDLGHTAQIARVMAHQYRTEVGPWVEYLPILTRGKEH